MKNKLFLLSVLGLTALSNYASAQCSNSGIGTTAPAAKLDVRGCGNDSTTAALKVANSTDTTVTPILFIRNDNRIGLGTKFPQTMLDVNGTIFSRQGFKFPDGTIQTTAASNIWSLGSGQYSLVNNSSGGNVAIAQSSFIGGGETNHIGYYGYNSIILGGINNYVGDDNCVILSGSGNTIQDPVIFQGGPGQSYNLISGGSNNLIYPQVTNSAIIHGYNNSIGSGVANSIILGGHDLSATQSNTVYMQNINVASWVGNGYRTLQVDSAGNLRAGNPTPQYFCGNPWCTNGNGNQNSGPNDFLGTIDSRDLIFKTNSNEVMRATAAGNLIIGNIPTPSAFQKLEVHGSISIYDGAGGSNPNDDGDNSLFFGREQTSLNNGAENYGEWGIQYWNGVSKQTATGGNNTWGGLNFWKPFGSTGTTGNNFLFLQDNGNIGIGTANPIANLDVNGTVGISGNVGIGTPTPQAKLDVTGTAAISGNVGIGTTPDVSLNNYRLSVCGAIHAQRVVIETFTCDFVFGNNYSLLSLKERQEKVLQNKHLINVPSAKEMDKNGNDLGTTTMGILQNVEEHELYLYKHDEKIAKLEQENSELNKKIAEQQKLLEQQGQAIEYLKKIMLQK